MVRAMGVFGSHKVLSWGMMHMAWMRVLNILVGDVLARIAIPGKLLSL